MGLKVTIASSGAHKTYRNSCEFKQYSGAKSAATSVITEAVAHIAADGMTVQQITSLKGDDKKIFKLKKFTIRRSLNKKDYIHSFSQKDMKNVKNLSVDDKYDIAAKLFYRIVCRTPYDENYKYTIIKRTASSYNMKINKRRPSHAKAYTYLHRKDNDVARDHWQLRIKTNKHLPSRMLSVIQAVR